MEKPRWMSVVLVAAGVYNLIWGCWVVLFPSSFFQWMELPEPTYLPIWQSVGMIVGVYGVGYWIAAGDPVRHWPIVLVGLLGKLFGAAGFLISYGLGQLPWVFGVLNVFNDLIWLPFFSAILFHAFRQSCDRGRFVAAPSMPELLRQSVSHRGQSIMALSQDRPTMMVFLRHSGCTFCRMVMADLGEVRAELDKLPVHVVVVHMGSPLDGTVILSKYNVDYWHHISDPFCVLYRGFGLQRGTFSQLFSWKVVRQGLYQATFGGHGIGALRGDSFYLPGVFVVHRGQVVFSQPADDATQRPDFVRIAELAAARFANDRGGCKLETADAS